MNLLEIIDRIGQDEFKAASWARNVGADVSGRGGRRTSIAAARAALAAARSQRLAKLRRSGARTQRVVAASHNAAATWGSSVNGVAPAVLRRLRASAARAFVRLSRGQSASKAMCAVGGAALNPAARINAAPIVEWATAVWTGFPKRSVLRQALAGAQKALAAKGGAWTWSKATTAAHGFLLTLDRVGWAAASERCLRTACGATVDMLRLPPAAIQRLVHEASSSWEQRDSVGGGATDVISWYPLKRLGFGLRQVAWSARHRAAFVKNISGTPWPGLEKGSGGQSDFRCLFCGEEGDGFHLAYLCQHFAEHRAQQTSAALRRAAGKVADQPDVRRSFARGALPRGTALAPEAKGGADAAISWVNQPASGIMSSAIFTDGAVYGVAAGLPRAGYSMVMVDDTVELLAACYGPLPADLCPSQTIADAEDFALAALATCAVAPMRIYTDRADTVKVAGGAEAAATKASCARAHLWSRFFAAFGGDTDVQVIKTLAHASAGDVAAGRSTAWERRGNDHADRLAKLGAQAHGLTRTHVAEAAVLGSIAFQAARWAGEVRVLAQQALQRGHHAARRPQRRMATLALETRGPKRQKAQPGVHPGQGSLWRGRGEEATRPEDDDHGGHKVAFAAVQG